MELSIRVDSVIYHKCGDPVSNFMQHPLIKMICTKHSEVLHIGNKGKEINFNKLVIGTISKNLSRMLNTCIRF